MEPEKKQDDFDVFGLDEGEEAEIKHLSRAIADLDKLRAAFYKHAGPDERMDPEEYKVFAKKLRLTDDAADRLWNTCDSDRNGVIDAYEFTTTLKMLTEARAWLRYCPTCRFENVCDYCVSQCAPCNNCSRERFCPEHWERHPGISPKDD